MEKQIKCKKCKLTYSKKKYECPYCHKKRFNPKGLIIFSIILLIALGSGYYFIKTNNITIAEPEKGIIFKNIVVEETDTANVYKVKFDIINKTNKSINKKYEVINLADKIKASVKQSSISNYYHDNQTIELNMINEEIYKEEYYIKTYGEWEKLEIYIREMYSDEEEKKVFTYDRKNVK